MELPRGMKDFENSEFLEIEFIRKKFLEISEIFNFKLMEPSPLELLSTLEAKGGETLRDDVYFFKDKGEREIALRFDFTIGLTRFIASQKSFKLPAKISSFGGVWRYDEPQKGRYRFFHQFDIEIFGKVNLEHDAEIIEFVSKFFEKIQLKNIVIDISHRKLVESYINKIFESNDEQIVSDILRAVDKIQKKSKQEIMSEFEKKGYSSTKLEKIIEFSKINGTPEEIEQKFDTNLLESWNDLKIIFKSLQNRNVNNIRINFGIVRGLDYYSGIVFEAFDTSFDIGALVGGGRYDNLPSIFGSNDLGATGVAGGIERIILSLNNQNSLHTIQNPRISVVYVNDDMQQIAINLASTLRDKGIFVDIDLSGKSLKKQMELSINSKFVVIIGPKEFSNGVVILRNMLDRTEKQIKIENLLLESKSIFNL
uniref:Histidine--tRNA ligase n=1 Tax=uncultured marine thaumarchaeote AD1000_88_E07 TaxID=1455946 RepID=A0A075G5A9_9ARCH|nr:histidyl-tRNA synthetase (HARS, hisS) [uncultured marine thaumarchaeote AD1000_88_E07]